MVYNRNFTLLCPLCGSPFHPTRLGQIYCCPAHGWEYRNQTNLLRNEKLKEKRKNRIRNLRILIKLQIAGEEYPDKTFLSENGFDFNVIYPCLTTMPQEESKDKYYKLFGFLFHDTGEDFWIFPPRHQFNILKEFDEEKEDLDW